MFRTASHAPNLERATLLSRLACKKTQRVYRRREEIATSGRDHPLIICSHGNIVGRSVCLNTKHATSSAAAIVVCLSNDQVMPRLELPLLGRVLELWIVHPFPCDELELPFDRGLIAGEEQATVARVRVTVRIGRGIEGVSEG